VFVQKVTVHFDESNKAVLWMQMPPLYIEDMEEE
jgi:hypothetical protein